MGEWSLYIGIFGLGAMVGIAAEFVLVAWIVGKRAVQ